MIIGAPSDDYNNFIKRVQARVRQRTPRPTPDDMLKAAFEDLNEQIGELRRAVARLESSEPGK